MAITVDTNNEAGQRIYAGQTDGNEVIFKLNAGQKYTMECRVTSAGTASMKITNAKDQQSDFSNMSVASDGTQSSNFIRDIYGCSYTGLDIASGTWTVEVRRV